MKHGCVSRIAAAVAPVDRPDETTLGTVLRDDHHRDDDRLHHRALVRFAGSGLLLRRHRHASGRGSETIARQERGSSRSRRFRGTVLAEFRRTQKALCRASSGASCLCNRRVLHVPITLGDGSGSGDKEVDRPDRRRTRFAVCAQLSPHLASTAPAVPMRSPRDA